MDTQKLRELADRRDKLIADIADVDANIAAIVGGNGVKPAKQRAAQKCSKCGEEGHSARTCPKKDTPTLPLA